MENATIPPSRKSAETQKLDTNAWIEAALDLLAAQGIDGVRVEPLAKQLHVTKGSFYWHFRDRDALLEAMLARWRRQATLQNIERIEQTHEPAPVRLKRLMDLPFHGARADRAAHIELSIRLWGRRDDRARSALEEVDQLRLHYIGQLLEQCGVPAEESRARAILVYCYMRVASTLFDGADSEVRARCEMALNPY